MHKKLDNNENTKISIFDSNETKDIDKNLVKTADDIVEILKNIKENGATDENITNLKQFYEKEKRHSYSKITEFILETKATSDDLQELAAKIDKIMKNEKNNEFKTSLFKLHDHISLELIRIDHLENIKSQTDIALKNAQTAQKLAKYAQKQAKDITKTHITILGIFASIVIAFVGNFAFTTSVLENIHNASIYRLLFVVCLLILFITNILHYLYRFLRQITSNDDELKENKTFWYINVPNIILFVVMVLIGVFWFISKCNLIKCFN